PCIVAATTARQAAALAERVSSAGPPAAAVVTERGANGLDHLRAAAAIGAGQDLLGSGHVLGSGRYRFWEEDSRVTGKGDQVEGLILAQMSERAPDGLFGHLQRKPPHGSGSIEHEDQLARHHTIVGDSFRRLKD